SNQIFTIGDIEGPSYSYAEWRGSCIDNDHLYLLGSAAYNSGSSAKIFFDDESNFLQRFVPDGSISFFVALDKNNGQYISQGIVPAFEAMASKTPAVISNRVFATASFNNSGNILLTEWRNDGLVVNKDTIHCVDSYVYYSQGLTANDNGYLLSSMISYSPVTFSNSVIADCNSPGMSNAVFALCHNQEWTTPFTPDDTVAIDEYYQKRENSIYLYPNPTDGKTAVCGYLWDYQSAELFD
ncbi:MAG: hypothetical protein J6P65_04365, partial [Bacteroidales bacterium]|nr:hypothetical protein [Bacteroidales bacterium]